MNSDPVVEFIVIDLDGGDMLTDCLHAIDAQSYASKRIILVDNGSAVPVMDRLPMLGTHLELLRLASNHGFAGGANAGILASTAPFVALINNDLVLDPQWTMKMLRELAANPRCAAVQSIILSTNGTVDGAGIAIERGRFRQLGHKASLATITNAEPWGISATAALYRRDALVDVAFDARVFDERFFAYYEDVELSARLRNRGWEVRLVPEPLATHRGSATAQRLASRGEHLRIRNRYWVARRHRGAGEVSALLFEDAKRIAGRIVRLDIGGALRCGRAVAAGLLADIN